MAATITRKPDIKDIVDGCLSTLHRNGVEACAEQVYSTLLLQKVKFPLLEYAAQLLYDQLSETEYRPFCDRIETYHTIGGNVLLGIIIQKRLAKNFDEAFGMAETYIGNADAWYICDIVGERVWGVSLLKYSDRAMPAIARLFDHTNRWVIRSLGAGIHYALKKGMPREQAAFTFQWLLAKATHHDKEIRQGIGWAAKTTAKFHPDLIRLHADQLNDPAQTGGWFRTKIQIGLARHRWRLEKLISGTN